MTPDIDARLEHMKTGEIVMAQLGLERLRASIESLLNGDFIDACERAQEAVGKLAPLAQAQGAFTRLAAGATVIRAVDIEEGMVVIGWGRVTGREFIEAVDPGTAPGVEIEYEMPNGESNKWLGGPAVELIVFPAGSE
jgi:hypothetical protein